MYKTSPYKVSPKLDVPGAYGVKRHEEAGKFKTKIRARDRKKILDETTTGTNVHRGARAAVANYKGMMNAVVLEAWDSLRRKFKPLSVGKSAFGDTYTVVVDDEVLKFLKLAEDKGSHRVRGSDPRLGDTIVVKIVKKRSEPFAEFINDNVTEAVAHQRMSANRDACVEIPCAPRVKECVADHIPTLHFAFLAKPVEFVTFMQLAGTTSLNSYLKTTRQKLDAEMYASIEKAVALMWASGFTHADLHSNNIMIDPTTKRAWIIDFGYAVRLPAAMRDRVKKRIGELVERGNASLGEIWSEAPSGENSLSSYTNKATQAKGISGWYNPNGRAVLLHYNKMSASERAKLEDVRKRLWKCTSLVAHPINASNTESELEEGEIRPPRAGNSKLEACKRKCEAIGKFCNPKTMRCVKAPPKKTPPVAGRNAKLEACERKCEAIGKFCNPKTMRCVKAPPKKTPPVVVRNANEAGPAHGPATARNLSAIEKRLKRPPKGGLKKYLEEKRAKCEAIGKKFNPLTGFCVKK